MKNKETNAGMNNEDFVTYEQAQILKEHGFDWKTHAFYNKEGELYSSDNPDYWNDEIWNEFCAPTLSQVQKWLREEKRIFLYIKLLVTKSFCVFEYIIDRMDTIDRIESKFQFDTYESALSAGIDKAFEILKEIDYIVSTKE